MEVVVIIANEYKISPFEVLNSDIDDFARLVNFLVETGNDGKAETKPKATKNKEQRIRVNDETATGGWW